MMRAMKQLGMSAAIIGAMSAAPVLAQELPADASNFYKSEDVTVRQVTFPNQYKMNIAGNPVSYTHLDVYKRQSCACCAAEKPPASAEDKAAQ